MARIAYYIGIDPGASTGLAVWCILTSQLEVVETTTFWQAYNTIRKSFDPGNTIIVIEDPSKNKPVFGHNESDRKKRERIAQNVGANKREAQLLIDGFERLGYTVQAVQPHTAKWDARTFKNLTRYKNICSQHARDAAKLVYGK